MVPRSIDLVNDTGFTMQDWRALSRDKKLCGILGCLKVPTVQCAHCGNYYCNEHSYVLNTVPHFKKK